MRKDFLVDPYQVLEARAAGAGGVLLIVRMLSREALAEMLDCARASSGCSCCSRPSTRDDIERRAASCAGRTALPANPRRRRWSVLVGVNCRDLQSLEVVPGRFAELAARLPPDCPRVAESGVQTCGGRRSAWRAPVIDWRSSAAR